MFKTFSDQKIVESWKKNAAPWITAVQQKQIESRRLVTDQAIIDEIMLASPKTVLDIGCGEGWLVRALSSVGISCTGLDVVPDLVEEASRSSAGEFLVLAYEEISAETIPNKFDAVVCNFSLLGKESVEHVFKSIPSILNPEGCLIVQTLHPLESSIQKEYMDGWRKGSWDGFSQEFCDPAPWYFRTTESWLGLYSDNEFELVRQVVPKNPKSGKAASLILVGKLTGNK